jgi:hypothetical protein
LLHQTNRRQELFRMHQWPRTSWQLEASSLQPVRQESKPWSILAPYTITASLAWEDKATLSSSPQGFSSWRTPIQICFASLCRWQPTKERCRLWLLIFTYSCSQQC